MCVFCDRYVKLVEKTVETMTRDMEIKDFIKSRDFLERKRLIKSIGT